MVWTAGIIAVVSIFGTGKDELKTPYRLTVCINGQTTDVWSDYRDKDFKRLAQPGYPEPTCGKCGVPITCPGKDKQVKID